MYNDYNCPVGADIPSASWHRREPPKKHFEVCISQSLSKNSSVYTNDYQEETEEDEEGKYISCNTKDTNWISAYNNEHYTPLQLIRKFKEMLVSAQPDPVIHPREYKQHQNLIKECEGWTEDDCEVIKD